MPRDLETIGEACNFLLQNYPVAQKVQSYLDDRINAEMQDFFKFGYFPDQENIHALSNMVGEEILEKEKFLFFKEIEDSLGRRTNRSSYFEDYPLVIPFRNVYGEIAGLVGRVLMSEEEREIKGIPKYRNNIGFPKTVHVFGLFENKEQIRAQNCVYVVEGQFDVIKAIEKGFRNIVGVGSNNMSAYQFSMISRYTDNIFLLLDNDEAGIKGRERIVGKFSKFANIRSVFLPQEFKDIDEFLNNHEYDEVEFLMKI